MISRNQEPATQRKQRHHDGGSRNSCDAQCWGVLPDMIAMFGRRAVGRKSSCCCLIEDLMAYSSELIMALQS